VRIAADEWERPLKSRWLFERLTGERARPDRPAPLDNGAQAQTFAGVRVLLVEDNIVNQRVGARLIERLGCRVDVAANGAEAIELLRQLPYDMVFMDCQMPEMDGFEATRRIRLMPGPVAAVPIIALTASASENDRQACLTRGMDGYLSKPASFASLAGMVNQWVNRTSTQQPSPELTVAVVQQP
jgi:CheY-like chemotaxis protein